MKRPRLTRLLKLLQLLQAGQGESVDGLSRRCGVSRRTTFRDLDALKTAGVPVRFDNQRKQYSVAPEYFLPATNLTPAEEESLITLAQQMGGEDRLPFFGPARDGAQKLLRAMPPRSRDRVQILTKAIHVRLSPVDRLAGRARYYQTLVTAIVERRVVRMNYGSLTEWENIVTKLRPYYLVFSRHSWYVIGRSTYHREPRTFNLARITSLELLEEKFARPRGFSLERYLGNAWHMICESGPDVAVALRFSSLVARNVAEVSWHRTQRTEPQPDGSLLFQVTVSGLNEIAWWILGYGDQVEVLRPAKLRRLVAQRVENMRRLYRPAERQPPPGGK